LHLAHAQREPADAVGRLRQSGERVRVCSHLRIS
jgi:hypothetical protein